MNQPSMNQLDINNSTNTNSDREQVTLFAQQKQKLIKELHKKVVGQDQVIKQLLLTILSGSHALFVGVPGLAKTLLIATLSETLKLNFNRIQFTPDLMPSDMTGAEILEEDPNNHQRHFRFMRGPVFTNILLADEINRTPPKTQAALLQAMQEKKVSVASHTYPIQAPFHVFATQNPIEQEGTYPLPEAQLDRFMFMVDVGYPSFEEEMQIVSYTPQTQTPIDPILGPEELLALQTLTMRIPVAKPLLEWAVRLVRATRKTELQAPDIVKQYVDFGAGPRATQHLILAAQASALFNGRFAVDIDDLKEQALFVLPHRLVLNYKGIAEKIKPQAIIEQLFRSVGTC